MRVQRLFALILCAIFAAGCSPATFLISKDGESAFFGRERSSFYRLLCTGEELKTILADADLSSDVKNDLYHYTCSDQRSYDKVVSLYVFLTPDEKKKLKSAFIKHGYEVNYLNC